jgi:hypothetical protein
MVRQDLKRLETLMAQTFEHNRSHFTASEQEDVVNRRSLSEIPSLRQSLDS